MTKCPFWAFVIRLWLIYFLSFLCWDVASCCFPGGRGQSKDRDGESKPGAYKTGDKWRQHKEEEAESCITPPTLVFTSLSLSVFFQVDPLCLLNRSLVQHPEFKAFIPVWTQASNFPFSGGWIISVCALLQPLYKLLQYLMVLHILPGNWA